MRTGGGASKTHFIQIWAWGVKSGLPHPISPFLTAISPAQSSVNTGVSEISERWRDSFLKVYFSKGGVELRIRVATGVQARQTFRSEKTFAILPLHLTTHLTGHIIAVWISRDALEKSLGWQTRRADPYAAVKTGNSKNLLRGASPHHLIHCTRRRSGLRLGIRFCSVTRSVYGVWRAASPLKPRTLTTLFPLRVWRLDQNFLIRRISLEVVVLAT